MCSRTIHKKLQDIGDVKHKMKMHIIHIIGLTIHKTKVTQERTLLHCSKEVQRTFIKAQPISVEAIALAIMSALAQLAINFSIFKMASVKKVRCLNRRQLTDETECIHVTVD